MAVADGSRPYSVTHGMVATEGVTKIMTENSPNPETANVIDNNRNEPPDWWKNPPPWLDSLKSSSNNDSSQQQQSQPPSPQKGYGSEILTVLQGLPEQLANVIREMNPTPSKPTDSKPEENTTKKPEKATKPPEHPEPGKKTFAERWFG